jgi:peptidoglycan/LPS O-acetylase OafA/YrhL
VAGSSNANRVAGLDSIRFLCALLVLFGHGMSPRLVDGFSKENLLGMIVRGVYNNLWNGPAAVIVFFVISGFCIHFAYVDPLRALEPFAYYTRRFIRLIIPAVVVVVTGPYFGVPFSDLNASVLWSLIAELVYYLIYPMLLRIRRRNGSWRSLVVLAYTASLGVVLTQPGNGDYPTYGIALNWILGLPCWLLGCVLAEWVATGRCGYESSRFSPTTVVWGARFAVCFAGWLCSVLRFHSPLGFPWTLNVFAILVLFWLRIEIDWRRTHQPPAILERAGVWSYSLYLTHPAAARFAVFLRYQLVPTDLVETPLLSVAVWCVKLVFILSVAYGFYKLVESPSHRLARWLSSVRRNADTVVV